MNELEFYAAAAQVIPLLFLVIVFEVRFWERDAYREQGAAWVRFTARAVDVFVLLLIVAGEAGALHALNAGHAGEWSQRLVVNALVVEGIVIVWFTWRVGGRGRLDTAEAMTQLVALLDERLTTGSSEAEESPKTEPDAPPNRATPGPLP